MHATITLAYHLIWRVPSQGTWNLLDSIASTPKESSLQSIILAPVYTHPCDLYVKNINMIKYANTYIILCSMWMYMVVNHTRNTLFHLLHTLINEYRVYIIHISYITFSVKLSTRRSSREFMARRVTGVLTKWSWIHVELLEYLRFCNLLVDTCLVVRNWVDWYRKCWRNGICRWFGPQNMIVMCFKTAAYVQ